jgi:hypothetical protein
VGQHPQPIILKVSKTISPSRHHFHFGVEAFGDAVGFTEASHGDDDLHAVHQCFGREPSTTTR